MSATRHSNSEAEYRAAICRIVDLPPEAPDSLIHSAIVLFEYRSVFRMNQEAMGLLNRAVQLEGYAAELEAKAKRK